ncbi:MAG: hypothetical protein RLZZ350_2583 [Verrucomicrobiota bacterium]
MKTVLLKSFGTLRRGLALVLAVGVSASVALAQPTVKTLAGGPKSFNLNNNGYRDGQTFSNAQFSFPSGMAINTNATLMFIADRSNNVVRSVALPAEATASQTTTFPLTNYYVTNRISRPVDVLVDGANSLYVLNRGTATNASGVATNGSIVKFNQYGNFLGTLATNLVNVTAFAVDGSTNLFVTFNTTNILRVPGNATNTLYPIYPSNPTNLITPLTTAGTRLNGIAVMDSGLLALADANSTNSGIFLWNPGNNTRTNLTGYNGTNEVFGTKDFATLNQPERIAKAGRGFLVVADRNNHRIKIIDPAGTITNLYGVASNIWFTIPNSQVLSVRPGWLDGPGVAYPTVDQNRSEAREPFGVCVSASGEVYVTEHYYHLLRKVSNTGMTGPGGVNNSGGLITSTNGSTSVVVGTPAINPNTGYFPMGRTITVNSGEPDIFYTTDGTEPTTNSTRVTMVNNTGTILWNQPKRDLSSLRVRAFIGDVGGSNAVGLVALTNSIGVPTGRSSTILAGVGATILVPVVATLKANDTVKSFQFRVEISPDGANTNAISSDFLPLSISSNELVSVVTAAQGGADAGFSFSQYTSNATQGIVINAIGNQANVSFQNYAVVAQLSIPSPPTAQPGQSYSIRVVWATATSDALQTPVAFDPAPATTITVTNVSYIVGDCAGAGWYNAGDFGDGNLANNDVNTIFYASLGLRVPDAFSDAFDCMDAFPEDALGFVGGDGQIRFLDWQIISDRSLRLQTNNWRRAWDSGGFRTNNSATLVVPPFARPAPTPPGQVWYRQAAVGAASSVSGLPGSTVDVPVFAKVISGASLAGLQFRAVVMPDAGAPALNAQVQFIAAANLPGPATPSVDLSQISCGWSLNTINLPASSSNYLGRVRFTIPANAQVGQSYTVTFANADGSPNFATQYDFETRRLSVRVGSTPAPAPDGISDEWKINFFGSVLSPLADPAADPDGDGSSNAEEFLNGTNPMSRASKLKLSPAALRTVGGQKQLPLQWLSAPGKIYSVERATSLGDNWSSIATVTGSGYVQESVETNLNPVAQFYRVRVISAP